MIWRSISLVWVNFCNFHGSNSVQNREILSHSKNISWNQLFSNFFNENIGFTKFLSIEDESMSNTQKFPHYCDWVIIWNIFPIWNFSWNHFTKELNSLVLKLVWRKKQENWKYNETMYIIFASNWRTYSINYQIELLIIDWYFN